MDTRKIKNIRHTAIKMDRAINDKSTVWKRIITYKVEWGNKKTCSTMYSLGDVYRNYELYQDGTFRLTDQLSNGEESSSGSFYFYKKGGEKSITRYIYTGSTYIPGWYTGSTEYNYDYWNGEIVEE